MRRIHYFYLALVLVLIFCTGCREPETRQNQETGPGMENKPERVYERLPEKLQWLTNDTDPVFASADARKGGYFRAALLSFPMTFRVVGPDSNGSFRGAILDNQLSLINLHPNTENIIPELATHWAFGEDKRTMYFKLDPDAKWSDGHPVTAWDYVYTLTFMRSEHIVAPWYNDYYAKEIESVRVFDDHTIGVKSTKAVPDLYLKLGIAPTPEHYFGALDSEFVQKHNWDIVPNTGAYQIHEFKKGRFIKFKRKQDWWAGDKKYFKNRFNVDYVLYTVIRDFNLQWEHFKKGRLDVFGLNLPKYWHDKTRTRVFENGYVNRIWFYNDLERPSHGMWLNQDKKIFEDKRLRHAFAHAMNIEKVIDKVLRGDYFRLAQAFFGYGKYTDYTIVPRQYDIGQVESLMGDAGWKRGKDGIWEKNGQRFFVTITYENDEYMPQLAVLKEDALKAGIELGLEKLDSTAAFKKILEKKHDVAWMGWSTGLRPSYWQGWHSDNAHKPQTNNITNTDDPELDGLIDRYRASLDEQERIGLSLAIQQKIHEIGAYVPTFMVPYVRTGYWRWLVLPEFHGTRMSEGLFDPFSSTVGGLFWIDKTIREQTLEAMKKGIRFESKIIVDAQFKINAAN
ncbi:MAG: extracellular solute-binding protein [Proteobacteria bacterium]|nr:ABC transporter substrate-binding protein [Desulfobacula sp.]MBU3954473.1 extracellular solute-binding protein [Pseudomonadota bacterium]MBU4130665.1 extracellular solute-binding protein [Pseudomonadota bacterium]